MLIWRTFLNMEETDLGGVGGGINVNNRVINHSSRGAKSFGFKDMSQGQRCCYFDG